MQVQQVMAQLKKLGNEQTRKTFRRHGADKDLFGVKIQDLKSIQKKIKCDHNLALQLYDTGNSDAMYLAALICDPGQMTTADLDRWAQQAPWYMISEYAVAWAAAESPHGWKIALRWIKSKEPQVACAGWSTLSSLVSILPDEDLDLGKLTKLLDQVARQIHKAPNRVRYVMNGFVISAGSYVVPLFDKAHEVAEAIGTVEVDVGDTSCKVPLATDYLAKIKKMGRLGKKRKTAFC